MALRDPFRLPEPFAVSFSGGRTSGYMLRRILDANGGRLPVRGRVLFTNTGKERPETLDFVEECARRWDVPITWLEYRRDREARLLNWGRNGQLAIGCHGWAVVDYATASRDGRPFDDLLEVMGEFRRAKGDDPVLPTTLGRFCTAEMKTRTMRRYLESVGWPVTDAECAVGIRADEPARLAKLKNMPEYDWAAGEPVAPLGAAGVTEPDVMAFWAAQPFDLKLRQYEGNCDLCFLKARWKTLQIMRDRPDLAQWWIDQEERAGQTFRKEKGRRYSLMLWESRHAELYDDGPGELEVACHCTD